MKTNLYLMRHAQSMANVLKIVQGAGLDVPLSADGTKQAKRISEAFQGFSFHKIFSSTALRACDTAKFIRRYYPGVPYEELSELNERSKGIAEGMPRSEFALKYSDVERQWQDGVDAKVDGGENLEDVEKRAMPLLKKYALANPEKNILFVTHGNLIKVVLGKILGISYGERIKLPQDYCALNCIVYDHGPGQWGIEFMNRALK